MSSSSKALGIQEGGQLLLGWLVGLEKWIRQIRKETERSKGRRGKQRGALDREEETGISGKEEAATGVLFYVHSIVFAKYFNWLCSLWGEGVLGNSWGEIRRHQNWRIALYSEFSTPSGP